MAETSSVLINYKEKADETAGALKAQHGKKSMSE